MPCHAMPCHGMAWHGMASHRIASHRIASHRIASHRIASHHHIISYVMWCDMIWYDMIWHDMIREDKIRQDMMWWYERVNWFQVNYLTITRTHIILISTCVSVSIDTCFIYIYLCGQHTDYNGRYDSTQCGHRVSNAKYHTRKSEVDCRNTTISWWQTITGVRIDW